MKYYFITYKSLYFCVTQNGQLNNATIWVTHNTVIDEHPVLWLKDNIVASRITSDIYYSNKKPRFECATTLDWYEWQLLSYEEITEAIYDEVYDILV